MAHPGDSIPTATSLYLFWKSSCQRSTFDSFLARPVTNSTPVPSNLHSLKSAHRYSTQARHQRTSLTDLSTNPRRATPLLHTNRTAHCQAKSASTDHLSHINSVPFLTTIGLQNATLIRALFIPSNFMSKDKVALPHPACARSGERTLTRGAPDSVPRVPKPSTARESEQLHSNLFLGLGQATLLYLYVSTRIVPTWSRLATRKNQQYPILRREADLAHDLVKRTTRAC